MSQKSTTLNGLRVFVLEDEAIIAMTIADSLTGLGCEVVGPALTTKDAARQIDGAGPLDAALLDVNLGKESSRNVAEALAARNVPFAFLTGYGRAALPEGFRERPLVSKPFAARDLAAAVESLAAPARKAG